MSSATEESIRCPACAEPMRESLLRGVPIDRCGNCRTVWLDGGELGAVLGAGVRLPNARDDGRASGSICPRCIAPLVGRSVGGSRWEGCRRCGGSLMASGTLAWLSEDGSSGRDRAAVKARAAAGATDPKRLARIAEEAWLGGPAVQRLAVPARLQFLASVYGWLLITAVAFGGGLALGQFGDWPPGSGRLWTWGSIALAAALVFGRRRVPWNAVLLCGFAATMGAGVGGFAAGVAATTVPTSPKLPAQVAPWLFLGVTTMGLAAMWATARHSHAEFHLTVGACAAAGAGAVFLGGLALGTGPLAVALLCATTVAACVGFGTVDVLRHYTARDAVAAAAHLWLLPVMALFTLWFYSDWRRAYLWQRYGRNRTDISWEDY